MEREYDALKPKAATKIRSCNTTSLRSAIGRGRRRRRDADRMCLALVAAGDLTKEGGAGRRGLGRGGTLPASACRLRALCSYRRTRRRIDPTLRLFGSAP